MGKWSHLFSARGGPDLSLQQLELPLERSREPDRNFARGGRSFYFFDFDDNVAFLSTKMVLFHRRDGTELQISSQEYAAHSGQIGRRGPYQDYRLDPDPTVGSFRYFRDKDISWLMRQLGHRQVFVNDLAAALGSPDLHWKGPSWSCFYHAVFNQRPLALITARGHHPSTLQQGIRLWVEDGHLPQEPNYLAIYPVSHPQVQEELGRPGSQSIPELKQLALRASVNRALQIYGANPHHRFGMSDDDPRNVEWIVAEMRRLKVEYPQMSFFMIQTHGERFIKSEVFSDHVDSQVLNNESQMTLFTDQ